MNKQRFINLVKDGAKEGYRRYGILPSLVISQAVLESGWGESDLFKNANNLFGIKSDERWKGEKILSPTKEYKNGRLIDTQAYFRRYDSAYDSILDHAEFLNNPRYHKVKLSKDYKQACKEIYIAKYATDPEYTDKLIKIIEQNKLYKFDEERNGYMYRIMLDAGHGGTDPGATAHGYKEKDLALKLCLDVRKKLEPYKDRLKVYLTREDDRFVSLKARSDMANKLNVDAFISDHLNSASTNTAKGTETFNFPGSKEGFMLATEIQNSIVENKLCLANRGVKQANFSVLRNTNMPSALLETCFINNKDDLNFFLNNYDKYVSVKAHAILKFFNIKPILKNQEVIAPNKPIINIDKNKINIMLIGEHVATEGFVKEGVSYIDVNGTYLSIREILENMQLKVDWDNELKLITADTTGEFIKEKDLTDVTLLGNKINVKTYKHKEKHCLKINNAYIPIRYIYESLGFKVAWESETKSVVIK